MKLYTVAILFVLDEGNTSVTATLVTISSRIPCSVLLTFQNLNSPVFTFEILSFLPYFTYNCLVWRFAVTTRSNKSKPLTAPSVKTAGPLWRTSATYKLDTVGSTSDKRTVPILTRVYTILFHYKPNTMFGLISTCKIRSFKRKGGRGGSWQKTEKSCRI